MCRKNCVGATATLLMMGLMACGPADAGLSQSGVSLDAALAKDPAGRVSVIAAASAAMPPPEPAEDGETPPPVDCDKALHNYKVVFTEISGMVEYHALYSLDPYQDAMNAAGEGNDKNCSLTLLGREKDCGELLSTFNEAFANLRGTAPYRALEATSGWHTLLVAYRTLKDGSCVE